MEKITISNIKDAFFFKTQKYENQRGYFCELYNSSKDYPQLNGTNRQINTSKSKKGVLRGIHITPFAKLVSCVHGSIQDVVVDMRPNSATYLNTFSIILSNKNQHQLYIPANCGHAFLSLEDDSTVVYLQDDVYNPQNERIINYSDPNLNIKWMLENLILSDKDKQAPHLEDFESIHH